MFYLGGVLNGAGKISFTVCDGDLPWVIKHTQEAWRGARTADREATYFVAPLGDSDDQVAVLDPAEIVAGLKGCCRGC